MKFEDLGLNEDILAAIKDCGYDTPTPIQEKAIPHILMARDVVGLAQTGTGKTASFTLPMIEILAGGRAKARMPRSLILSPTRELAAQIAENFDLYGKNSKLTKALLIGGSSMAEQVKILDRGADVLIATPGRLLDLFGRGKILLTDIKVLVIDEADRMLDMGFIPDIEDICSKLPPMRQTLLFSATMAPEIKKLTEKFLSNPREVAVSKPASTASTVEQFMVNTAPKRKDYAVENIIKREKVQTAFIFCNRKTSVDSLSKYLYSKGHDAHGLHGDMSQPVRTKTLKKFKDGEIKLLVCSDVAARGIDVQSVSHVINYDVPINPDDYVHRIGRTGRAGEKGRAWMLVTKYDEKQLDAIVKRIGKEIEVVDIEGGSSSSSSGSNSGVKPKPKVVTQGNTQPSKPQVNKPQANKPQAIKKNTVKKQANKPTNKPEPSVNGFGDEIPSFFNV